jgi:hypothetical protein
MPLNTGERHMPTDRLTPGLKAELVTTVDDKLVVRHMGGDGVLSTPSMIGLMERAGIQAVQDYLPEGHTTVGGIRRGQEGRRRHPPARNNCHSAQGLISDPSPSLADIQMTKAIIDIASPLGISVHDHIIVGKNGHASMRANYPKCLISNSVRTRTFRVEC